jgi:hypothetical protein
MVEQQGVIGNTGDVPMNSFRRRDKANRDLITEVNAMIIRFREEHREMAARLAANADLLHCSLSLDEQERIDRYNALMNTIQKELQEIRQTVSSCRTDAVEMIRGFSEGRERMSAEIQAFLEEATANRKKEEQSRILEFGEMMSDIREYNVSLEQEVNDMMERFANDHEQMAAELRGSLEKNSDERTEKTKELLAGIRVRMQEIANENVAAAQELRSAIQQGEAERMDEYHKLFSRISSEVDSLRKSTAEMLTRFSEERAADSAGWPVEPEPMAVVEPIEVASVEEPVVEKTVEVVEQAVEEAETAVVDEAQSSQAMDSLEDRVLAFINSSTGGVRVSDMEKPLGETRMKIGVAARNLLDAGKIVKFENYYQSLGK